MVKVLALIAAFVMAITPVVVTSVNDDIVTVDIRGNSYEFRGTNFHEGERIRVVFFAEGVWGVLP